MQYTQYIKLIDILGTHIINIFETFFLSNSSNADSWILENTKILKRV